MKKLILSILLVLTFAPQALSVCSIDPNNPATTNIISMTAGEVVFWRIRGTAPDYNTYGGYVDINVDPLRPSWVSFGTRIAPDANQYSWASSTDCDGNAIITASAYSVSRRVMFAPPKSVSGVFDIKWSVTDGNLTTYAKIVLTVTKPPRKLPFPDSGPDAVTTPLGPVARINVLAGNARIEDN